MRSHNASSTSNAGAHLLDTGVVDQNIEAAKRRRRLADATPAIVGTGDVHGDGSRFPAPLANCRRRRRQSVEPPRRNRHIGTRLRESDGDYRADAATGAGDQRAPTLQAEHAGHPDKTPI